MASIWAYMCSILKVHSQHSLCLSIPKFTYLIYQYSKTLAVKKRLQLQLICAVYLEYIVIIHFVHLYPNLLTLYIQYTKTLAAKKWLPFEFTCAVYLEYIVTIHFVCPYTNLLTLYIQWYVTSDRICLEHKKQAIKNGFHLSLYVRYTKNTL